MVQMKLVLTQEVTGLGEPGDVVEVKPGYGRNWLLPQGKAMLATRGVEKQVAQIKVARAARAARNLEHATELAAQLSALKVTLTARTGKENRLFGSITTHQIADAVTKAGGPVLDARRIELATPIKAVGSHTATVRLHPDVVATVHVEVVGA